jgi:hypothetical protein
MQVAPPLQYLHLVLVSSTVVCVRCMKWLMNISNKVNNVFQRNQSRLAIST